MGAALLIILIALITVAGLLGYFELAERIWMLRRQLQETEQLVMGLIARNSSQGGDTTTQCLPRERIKMKRFHPDLHQIATDHPG